MKRSSSKRAGRSSRLLSIDSFRRTTSLHECVGTFRKLVVAIQFRLNFGARALCQPRFYFAVIDLENDLNQAKANKILKWDFGIVPNGDPPFPLDVCDGIDPRRNLPRPLRLAGIIEFV